MLSRAARVLGLKPPLEESYGDALAEATNFAPSALMSPSRASSIVGSGIRDNLGPAVVGDIKVQNFTVTLVSPKFIIPDTSRSKGAEKVSDSASDARSPRRTSFGASSFTTPRKRLAAEVRDCFYIIALELSVPIIATPPQSPFMVSTTLF